MSTETTQRPSIDDAVTAAFEAEDKRLAADPRDEQTQELATAAPDDLKAVEQNLQDTIPKTAPARDAGGRFTAKAEASAAKSAKAAADKPEALNPDAAQHEQTTKPEKPAVAAPVGWQGEARAAWSALPDAVKTEVMRREREVAVSLARAKPASVAYAELQKTLAPYKQMMEAEGGTWQQGLQSHLQTAALLRMGSLQQKAAFAAQTMLAFGIDPGAVADAYAAAQGGGQAPAQAAAVRPAQSLPYQPDPRVDNLMAQFETMRAQQEAVYDQQALQEIEAVAHFPHFEELSEEIEHLLTTVRLPGGRELTLQVAYNMAIAAHPELAQEELARQLAARESEQRAKLSEQAAAAKAASASISGRSTVGNGARSRPKDLGSAVDAAFDQFWPAGS